MIKKKRTPTATRTLKRPAAFLAEGLLPPNRPASSDGLHGEECGEGGGGRWFFLDRALWGVFWCVFKGFWGFSRGFQGFLNSLVSKFLGFLWLFSWISLGFDRFFLGFA